MKKILVIFSCFLFLNCEDNVFTNDCFREVTINDIVNLNNPEFIDIKVPGGHSITNLSGRTILIIRRTESQYKAFDLQCPSKDCADAMSFDGLKLKCSCDKKEYNSLNGSPINGQGCFALEYNVIQTSENTLQITR